MLFGMSTPTSVIRISIISVTPGFRGSGQADNRASERGQDTIAYFVLKPDQSFRDSL